MKIVGVINMKSNSFYEKNLNEGNNPEIEEFINHLFLTLEHAQVNDNFDEKLQPIYELDIDDLIFLSFIL